MTPKPSNPLPKPDYYAHFPHGTTFHARHRWPTGGSTEDPCSTIRSAQPLSPRDAVEVGVKAVLGARTRSTSGGLGDLLGEPYIGPLQYSIMAPPSAFVAAAEADEIECHLLCRGDVSLRCSAL